MLLNFTDAMSGKLIAINPQNIVAILESPKTEEVPGNTVVNLITGSVVLEENILVDIGRINGELK